MTLLTCWSELPNEPYTFVHLSPLYNVADLDGRSAQLSSDASSIEVDALWSGIELFILPSAFYIS